MRMLSKFLFLTIVPTLLLESCKTTGKTKTSELESEISGLSDKVPGNMGYGFESETQTLKSQCISGFPQWAGAFESKVNYGQDLDLSTLQNIFAGGAKLGVKLAIFDIKGAADVAVREAVDEYSSSVSLTNEITLKRKALNFPYLTTVGAQEFADGKVKESVRARCGDEFVKYIVYGASLFVNAKFHFQTKEDKLEFKGSASVSLAGIGELGGHINHLSDKLKRNSKVTIYARQVGGDVEKLTKILTTDIITCSLADFDKSCLPMLKRLVEYAKDEFPKGLENVPPVDGAEPAKGWAQLRFVTIPYKDEAVFTKATDAKNEYEKNKNNPETTVAASANAINLVSPIEQSLVNDQIDDARISLYLATQKLLKDKERVGMLLSGFQINDLERADLEDIQGILETNNLYLQKANQACVSTPSKCIDNYNEFKRKEQPYKSLRGFGQTCFTTADLEGTKWNFKRIVPNSADDNSPLGKVQVIGQVELLKDGTIGGQWGDKSRFEQYWSVQNCMLRFQGVEKDKDGKIVRKIQTTIFDSIESRERMTGVFLHNVDFRHLLERA